MERCTHEYIYSLASQSQINPRSTPGWQRSARTWGQCFNFFPTYIWSSFFIFVQKVSSPCPEMCLPVEVTRTQCRNSFLNKFTIIRPPNQWIATRTGRRKVMLLPKGWKLTKVCLLVSISITFSKDIHFRCKTCQNITNQINLGFFYNATRNKYTAF